MESFKDALHKEERKYDELKNAMLNLNRAMEKNMDGRMWDSSLGGTADCIIIEKCTLEFLADDYEDDDIPKDFEGIVEEWNEVRKLIELKPLYHEQFESEPNE